MANFDNFREEFDKLSDKEKFRLGMAGAMGGSRNMQITTRLVGESSSEVEMSPKSLDGMASMISNSMEKTRRDMKKDMVDAMSMIDDSSSVRSSSLSGQIHRVKITNALSDIVEPLSEMHRALHFDMKVNLMTHMAMVSRKLSGIIESVANIPTTIIDRIRFSVDRFMRHPVWNSLAMIAKPLTSLISGTLFGFGKKSDTDRIVDALEDQTEVIEKGSKDGGGLLGRIWNKGVLGALGNAFARNVKGIFSKEDDRQSPQQKSVNILEEILKTNKDTYEHHKESSKKQLTFFTSTVAGLLEHIYEATSNQTKRLNGPALRTYSEEELTHLREEAKKREGYMDESITVQKKTAESSEDMNKRERRRSLLGLLKGGMGAIGSLISNFGGILGVGALAGTAWFLSPDKVKEVIGDGIKWGFNASGLADKWDSVSILDKLGGIGTGIAGLLAMFSPLLAGKAVIGVGIMWGYGKLLEGAVEWARSKQGDVPAWAEGLPESWKNALFGVSQEEQKKAIEELFAENRKTPNSRFLSMSSNTDFALTKERQEAAYRERINRLEDQRQKLFDIADESGDYNTYDPELVKLNDELKLLRDSIRELNNTNTSLMDGMIDPYALESAIRVGSTGSLSDIVGSDRGIKGFLDVIGRYESGGRTGNYNRLVGGSTANLTDMTVQEALDFQRHMARTGKYETGAIGKYQIMPKTLRGLVRNTGIDPTKTKFDKKTQDMFAIELMKGRGLNKFLSGDVSADWFADQLAQEWAAFPNRNNVSAHKGKGSNKKGLERNKFMAHVEAIRSPMTTGERLSGMVDDTRDAVARGGSSVAEVMSVITGGALDLGGGFLDGIKGLMGDEANADQPEQKAIIDRESMIELTNALSNVLKQIPIGAGQTIDVSGIGD